MRKTMFVAPLVAVLLFASAAVPAHAASLTEMQISAIIGLLQSFGADSGTVASVNATLHGQATTGGTASSACVNLSYNLYADQTDATTNGEVTKLQQFLAQDSSIYPSSLVTGYFGPMTEDAVQAWQAAHGVVSSGSPDTTGYGYVGPKTRVAMECGSGLTSTNTNTTTNTNTQTTPTTIAPKSSVLTAQIKVTSPGNMTVSVGGKVTITYTVGSNIVAGDPAIIERSIVDANTGAVNSGYVPVTQSAGTYRFDWTPNEPGSYQALLKINLDNVQYTAKSGVITATGSTISASNLLTPTVSVNLSPSSVTAGQSSLLYWSSTNTNRCVLQYGSSEENISVSGSKTVTPSQSTTYLVWCANDPGNGKDGPATSASATLSVSAATLATPFVTLQAYPTTVGAVQSSTLSWSTTNADRCVLQYGSTEENVGVSGSKTVSPSQTTSYRLICTNDPGNGKDGPSAEKTVSVTVASPSCSLTTNNNSYNYGDTITFSWTSQNATYTTFQQDTSGKDHLSLPGDKGGTSGSYSTTASVTGNPSATLLVYNYYGNSSCSVTVPVN